MNEAEFYWKNYGDQRGCYPRSPSDYAKAKFNKLFYYSFKKIPSLKTSYALIPPSMLSSSSIVHVNQ